MNVKVIETSEGMILTDGKTYGRKIYLDESVDISDFKKITKEEYEKILKEQERKEREANAE